MTEAGRFFWPDYLVFGLVMAISALVGVYFGIKDRRKMDTEQFLMAGRKMNVFPVSVSLFVSWCSTISFLGDPVECYSHGVAYFAHVAGYLLALPIIAQFFVPVYHKMTLVSAYELLGRRYSMKMRLLGTLASSVVTILWMAFATYAAGIALTQASGMKLAWALVIIGVVCTFYTSLGGMKAVLWADTIQMLIMVVGQILMIVMGVRRVGGIQQVWRIAGDGGRLNFNMDNLTLSLISQTSILAFIFGGFSRIANPYISTQLFVQRYGTVRTTGEAKLTVFLTMPMYLCLVMTMTASGLIMYAVYHDCDPLAAGIIERRDQMVPLMMIELLSFMPGLPGLFMASLFSAALSTLSSGINALSAQMLNDISQPLYKRIHKRQMPEKLSAFLAKIFAVACGVIATGMASLPAVVGESIFATSAQVIGLIMSPLTGIFIVAVLLPNIKVPAVLTGFLVTLAVSLWLFIGSELIGHTSHTLPMETYGCLPDTNESTTMTATPQTTMMTTTIEWMTTTNTGVHNMTLHFTDTEGQFVFKDIYRIAHIHYFTFGMISTVSISIIVHLIKVLCQRCFGKEAVSSADMPVRQDRHGPVQSDYVKTVFGSGEHLEALNQGTPLMWHGQDFGVESSPDGATGRPREDRVELTSRKIRAKEDERMLHGDL